MAVDETQEPLYPRNHPYSSASAVGAPDEQDLLQAQNLDMRERATRAELRAEVLTRALQTADPRNATETYDRIADDFYAKTHIWPPGRSRPAEMGADDSDNDENRKKWRAHCNAWWEALFDAALNPQPPPQRPAPAEPAILVEAAVSPGAHCTPRGWHLFAEDSDVCLCGSRNRGRASLDPAPTTEKCDHDWVSVHCDAGRSETTVCSKCQVPRWPSRPGPAPEAK